jgi:hypothetical protein
MLCGMYLSDLARFVVYLRFSCIFIISVFSQINMNLSEENSNQFANVKGVPNQVSESRNILQHSIHVCTKMAYSSPFPNGFPWRATGCTKVSGWMWYSLTSNLTRKTGKEIFDIVATVGYANGICRGKARLARLRRGAFGANHAVRTEGMRRRLPAIRVDIEGCRAGAQEHWPEAANGHLRAESRGRSHEGPTVR